MTISVCPADLGSPNPSPSMVAFDGLVALGPLSKKFAQPPTGNGTRRGLVIPYLTLRSGERPTPHSSLVIRPDGHGVGRRHEGPEERDHHNLLWQGTSLPDRKAEPRLKSVHPLRQREVMLRMLCQVCCGQPSRTNQGTLFFHLQGPAADPRWWPNSELTIHPPVCLKCACAALSRCRFVARAQAVRVKKPRIWGVVGTQYQPTALGRLQRVSMDATCEYSNRKVSRWMVARQAIAELNRCTVVDIREELTAARLDVPARLAS